MGVRCPRRGTENPSDAKYGKERAGPLRPHGESALCGTRSMESPPSKINTLIAGKYRILGESGQGGMGIVYEALVNRMRPGWEELES